ncbi:hypothetical protein BGW36DRAFT_295276, partial [Talaromyces proteolyticus]
LYIVSAVGAIVVARSIMCFSFPLFADYMFEAPGEGWDNSVLAFTVLRTVFMGCLALWFYNK